MVKKRPTSPLQPMAHPYVLGGPVLRLGELSVDILFYTALMVGVASVAAATWALLREW
jgi:hypothetical protein